MANKPPWTLEEYAPEPNVSYPSDTRPAELRAASDDAERVWGEIVEGIISRRRVHRTPAILHHYTDVNGLKGIVFDGQFWLGDYRSTNDPMEGQQARVVIEKCIRAFTGLAQCSAFTQEMPEPAVVTSMREALDQRYLASLTEDDDFLAHWIHYSENGAGYCIGFDGPLLANTPVDLGGVQRLDPILFPVIYSESDQEAEVRTILTATDNLYTRHEKILKVNEFAFNELKAIVSGVVRSAASDLALDYKNPRFAVEREWRYIVRPRTLVLEKPMRLFLPGVRTRGQSLVSYTPLPVGPDGPFQLRTIKSGPRADHEQLTRIVGYHRLRQHRNVTVSASEIPLR